MSADNTSTTDEQVERKSFRARLVQEAREWLATLAVFVPAFFVFSLVLFELRVIPSESMIPNLRVGDRVVVSKFAYGYSRYSVPWGLGRVLPLGDGRLFARAPERGDVAVFKHPHFDRVMIKRIIGLPGDTVQLRDEQLFLNGRPVPTEYLGVKRMVAHGEAQPADVRAYRETVGDESWITHQWVAGFPGDSTPVFEVPAGHLLFIGDNRDNSKDGRDLSGHCPVRGGTISQAGCPLPAGLPARDASVGFVPMDHLIGRAETVLFSTYSCPNRPGLDCPEGKLWKGL